MGVRLADWKIGIRASFYGCDGNGLVPFTGRVPARYIKHGHLSACPPLEAGTSIEP